MTLRLQKVDELSIADHYYLEPSDECWYFGEYTAYKDWSFSKTNQLVKNFKKKMSLQGTNQWQYKMLAIREVGQLIAGTINRDRLNGVIFVPIPPSKIRTDPEFDPRITQALSQASNFLNVALPISECITQRSNAEPDHLSGVPRLTPQERAESYDIHIERIPNNTNVVVIVDDVITSGSHYKGAEIAIRRILPNASFAGLFIARTVRDNCNLDDDFDFNQFINN